MDHKKEIYLVISDQHDPSHTFGQSIRATCQTATNFKRAYDLALSIGEIREPSLGYKASLARCESEWAVQLECKVSSNKVTIALVKKWT